MVIFSRLDVVVIEQRPGGNDVALLADNLFTFGVVKPVAISVYRKVHGFALPIELDRSYGGVFDRLVTVVFPPNSAVLRCLWKT